MNSTASEWTSVLGWTLVNFVWQGALIGAAAVLLLLLLRDARPHVRYGLSCAALLLCVLAPAATAIYLSLDVAGASTESRVGLAATSLGDTARGASLLALTESFPIIVWGWAAGALATVARMTLGLAWIERLRRTPCTPLSEHWQHTVDQWALRMGVRGHVALRIVDTLDTPVTAGWLRPIVLLPLGVATGLPAHLVEALIAHELSHILRRDYLVNILQGVVEALLFYHPVVWWLSRRIRVERELIADELAASHLRDPKQLAIALAHLSELRATAPSSVAALAACDGDVLSRIRRLTAALAPRPRPRLVAPLIATVTACVIVVANASVITPPPVRDVLPIAAIRGATIMTGFRLSEGDAALVSPGRRDRATPAAGVDSDAKANVQATRTNSRGSVQLDGEPAGVPRPPFAGEMAGHPVRGPSRHGPVAGPAPGPHVGPEMPVALSRSPEAREIARAIRREESRLALNGTRVMQELLRPSSDRLDAETRSEFLRLGRDYARLVALRGTAAADREHEAAIRDELNRLSAQTGTPGVLAADEITARVVADSSSLNALRLRDAAAVDRAPSSRAGPGDYGPDGPPRPRPIE